MNIIKWLKTLLYYSVFFLDFKLGITLKFMFLKALSKCTHHNIQHEKIILIDVLYNRFVEHCIYQCYYFLKFLKINFECSTKVIWM